MLMDDKSNKILTNCLKHAEKHISENSSNFSSIKTAYRNLIKKEKFDPTTEYTKEIIKRLERDKVTAQAAMSVSESMMPEMQSMRNQVLIMAMPLLIGGLLMVIFGLLLFFTKPFSIENNFVIGYSIGLFIGTVAFIFGFTQRTKVKINTLSKTMVFHAVSAYGAAKMQGQGSFGAFRLLEEMKTKQGKPMQVRVNKPQIMYKAR